MQRILLVLALLFTFIPFDHAAAAPNIKKIEETDTYNTVTKPFYYRWMGDNDAFTVEIRDKTVYKVYVSSYSDDFTTQGTEKVVEPGGGRYLLRYNLTCNTSYELKFYNSSGMEIYKSKWTVTGLENPLCNSDGDENDENLGGGGIDCDICAALQDIKGSLNGSNDKLDQIIDKIPPPPNWQEVANTMRDTIVPQLVGDTKDMLDDLLGRAPAPPPAPQQPDAPPDLDMPNVGDMPDAPSVDLPPAEQDNNFTADDVIKDAPEIKYEEPDEADEGFDLSVDPYKHLENPGSPGTPKEPDDPGSPGTPNQDVDAPPKPDVPNYDPGSPGTPNQDVGAPGKPNDDSLKPSNPGDNIGAPPGEYNPS